MRSTDTPWRSRQAVRETGTTSGDLSVVDRYKSTNTDATVRDFEGLRALVTLEDVSLNQIDADSFRFSHNTGQGEDYSELIDF